MSRSIKLGEETISALQAEADTQSRTLSEQAEHWIRLGRAVEALPEMSIARVHLALHGLFPHQRLSAGEMLQFLDLMAVPGEQSERHVEELVMRGHAVGYDENDVLMESMQGGGYRPVRRTSSAIASEAFWEGRRRQGLGIGELEDGTLVRQLPDGMTGPV
jgi:hypothetical protein